VIDNSSSVVSRVTAIWQTVQLEYTIQTNIGTTNIPTPQSLCPRRISPHNPHFSILYFTHKRDWVLAVQIQSKGRTSHQLLAQGRHLARAHFAKHPAARQGTYSITDELLNQITPATHAGSIPEGPFVLIVLRHLKRWECHVTVGAHDGRREPWEVFDFPSQDIKPIVPPVAPLVPSAGDYFHDFRRSLSGPRLEGARPKLCNLISDFPLLPVQTIVLGKDLHGRLTAVRGHRRDILRMGNHGVRCQLVDLDVEPLQDLRHEMMRR
jgi:hypothetical protein